MAETDTLRMLFAAVQRATALHLETRSASTRRLLAHTSWYSDRRVSCLIKRATKVLSNRRLFWKRNTLALRSESAPNRPALRLDTLDPRTHITDMAVPHGAELVFVTRKL